MIANLKRFVGGTFLGVSATHLQEYVDELVYRCNHRHWENQLSRRLAATPMPIQLQLR